MVISHNILAMNANRQFDIVGRRQAKNMEKLSSGYKINRAADDAAGLAISEKMRRLIRGLNKGIENVQDGVSLCQIADGALNEVHDMLHRLEELSVKAANGTNTESDREAIQQEVDQILSEIDRISETSTFNEQKIFSEGTASASGTASGTGAVQSPTDTPSQTVGAFTVTGGTLGVDYTFENGVLKIISDTSITIRNTKPNVATTNCIEVASGVNVNITLAGVNIVTSSGAAFKIADNSKGNVTISLADGTNNILKSGSGCAGLQKNGSTSSGTLTIKGNTGTLTATGGSQGAGIGSGYNNNGSNIIISGGKVTAIGGTGGAGIGGGYGDYWASSTYGDGSNITISGGTVTAIGGSEGAGIGGGKDGNGSNITISGATITATGGLGSNESGSGGAGIGGGSGGIVGGDANNITISDSTVTATGAGYGAGIGGGRAGDSNNITITGSTVTATGGKSGAAGIGGGGASSWVGGNGGKITISDSVVTANGGGGGAGIGNGTGGSRNDIGISDSMIIEGDTETVYGDFTSDNNSGGDSQFASALGGSKRWWIQCGSESGVGMFVEIESIDTVTLGIHGMDITTQESADKAISMISGALEKVSSVRSNIGAQQNRLEHTIANENNIVENTTAAESRIRDSDMAKEILDLTIANILAQAGISVLAQANTTNEEVLMLLR